MAASGIAAASSSVSGDHHDTLEQQGGRRYGHYRDAELHVRIMPARSNMHIYASDGVWLYGPGGQMLASY